MKPTIKNSFIFLMLILLIMSVPWYRSDEQMSNTLFGFPEWVMVAIACYLAVTLINIGIWLSNASISDKKNSDKTNS